jgi:hypothetical protein
MKRGKYGANAPPARRPPPNAEGKKEAARGVQGTNPIIRERKIDG